MILVTGAAGFIGSYLARELLSERGPQGLVACDDPVAWETRRCSRKLREAGVPFVETASLASELRRSDRSFDGVLHMGASSRTDETREEFLQRVNVEASRFLWDFCRDRKIPFVYASSASTYGAGENGYSDDPAFLEKLKPLNAYGRSKHKFDLWALDESLEGRQPPRWAGLKFFNVYGPGEDHKGSQASVVHHARRQFETQGYVTLFRSHNPKYGDGRQMRDFVYVGDCARVARAALDGRLSSGIFNVGTGLAHTWLDLAEAVAEALGRPNRVEFVDTPEHLRPHYQYFTQAELARLRAAGYQADFTSLKDGVRRTFQEELDL